MKKIIFILMFICLALPCSAWEITGEDPDEDLSVITLDAAYWEQSPSTGHYLKYYWTSTWGSITINKNFDPDYIAFTAKRGSEAAGLGLDVILKGVSGSTLTNIRIENYLSTNYKRFEIIAGLPGRVDLYVDGVFVNSYVISDGDATGITFICMNNGGMYGKEFYLDDISDEYYVIGCNNEVEFTDSNFFFSYGYPKTPESEFLIRLRSPNGSLVQEWNTTLTAVGSYYLDRDDYFTVSGEYSLRLYMKDQLSGNIYLSYIEPITYTIPDPASIHVLNSEIERGKKIGIICHNADGYSLKIVYNSDSPNGYTSYEINGDEEEYLFTIPQNTGNYIFLYLVNPGGTIIDFLQLEVVGQSQPPAIKLDKSSYISTDTIRVQYWYMPLGTDLIFNFYFSGEKIASYTYEIDDIIGFQDFQIGVIEEVDSVSVMARSENQIYATSTATILYGNYALSGKVYDAVTGASIPNAIVFTDVFTTTTNNIGEYNHSITPGWHNVTVNCDGYEDHHTSMYITNFLTTKNFYLSPITVSETGSSVYGLVSNYYNGTSIQGALVTIKNGSTSYTALTTSKGYYSIEKPLEGTWIIKVSKSGYDTYTTSVVVSGDTYKGVRLVPVSGATPDPDTGGSGSDTGGSGTDRPGRQAARDSMAQLESIIPGLISFVVLVVFIQLIKEM